jgi:hypothetical protein
LPHTLTQIKFDINNSFTYNQRLASLNIFATLVGLATLRFSGRGGGFRVFSMVKNICVSYAIGGVLIVP